MSNTEKIIGFKPAVDLPNGLKDTITWFIENQKEHNLKKNYFI